MTMTLIGSDDGVLNYFRNEHTLLDARMTQFSVYTKDYVLTIDIHFELARSKKNVALIFKDIIEYAFYYNNTHLFYYVERLKFFKSGQGFYLSLDPESENEQVSDNDNDMILSKHVEGYIMNNN